MTDARDIGADLEPGAPAELVRLGERLQQQRPLPAMAFRGDLRRRLMSQGTVRSRPARLHAMIAATATGGALLLLVGALSAAGAGPLGA